MHLLERYLWKNLLLSIFMTWLSLSLLFSLFDFIAELGAAGKLPGYGTWQALLYILFSLPRNLYTNFPYAVLIGSLLGLGNLAANSEIVAMRAAGFSIWRILSTTLQLGVILGLLAFVLGEYWVPQSEAYARHFKQQFKESGVEVSAEGAWLKHGQRLLHIDKVWSAVKLEGISIYEVDLERGGLSRITKAIAAYKKPQTEWVLSEVLDKRISSTGVHIARYTELTVPDLLPENILNFATVTPEELTAKELAEFIQHQRENALNSSFFELEYWKHFTTPLSTLVMLVLAVPLVFGFQRNAGAGQRIFIGIVLGISYLLLDRMINRTGLVYGLPSLLSAIVPLLLFTALGLLMLKRVR
ncbi:MAG: LPS export ABC transporter permease LptG [Proteobacteria bacterium]|nr:MAG: LPS export ABC transporter permease LptG [Pseudomonadota bacterium]